MARRWDALGPFGPIARFARVVARPAAARVRQTEHIYENHSKHRDDGALRPSQTVLIPPAFLPGKADRCRLPRGMRGVCEARALPTLENYRCRSIPIVAENATTSSKSCCCLRRLSKAWFARNARRRRLSGALRHSPPSRALRIRRQAAVRARVRLAPSATEPGCLV